MFRAAGANALDAHILLNGFGDDYIRAEAGEGTIAGSSQNRSNWYCWFISHEELLAHLDDLERVVID